MLTLPIYPAFLLDEEISEGVHKGVKLSDEQPDHILKLVHESVNENVYDIKNQITR